MGLKNLRSKASEKAEHKFDKKVQFYAKVRSQTVAATKTISKSKSAARRQAKKLKELKAYDFSSLTELLPELNLKKEVDAPAKYKLNSKLRKKLLLEEGKQMAAVLSKEAFKSDPLAAIYQHLQSTQPAIEIPEKKKKKETEKKKKKKKKKKKGKKPTPALDMEM